MTTVLLSTGLFLAGSACLAASHPAVRVAGVCATLAGMFFWFGLGTVCGWSAPLSQCVVVQ